MAIAHSLSAPETAAVRRPEFPLFFGLLDGFAGLAYLLHAPIVDWHAGVLCLKCLGLILGRRTLKSPSRVGWGMAAGVATVIVASTLAGTGQTLAIIGAVGFLTELLLTLLILDEEKLPIYARGIAYAVGITAVLHFGLVFAHKVPSLYGRYTYLGASHPNLGGEIEATGAVAAGLSLRRWRALALIAFLFIDSNTMQARSALIAEALVLIVVAVHNPQRKMGVARMLTLAFAGLAGLTILVTMGSANPITQSISSVLLLNNEYRGVSSGFSGRSDLWLTAIDLFNSSPIIGHGLGYYDIIDYVGPHNVLLYGLGEDGLSSMVLIASIVVGYILSLRNNPYVGIVLMCALPLFMFNDRFINLNPFPFVIYVMIAVASGRSISRSRYQQAPRPWAAQPG